MSSDLISLYTGIIPDLANIITEYIPQLYIYHIFREDYDYDQYSDFVAISESISRSRYEIFI